MIPDELIEKALYAYDTAAGPPYSSTDGMRAALEAVAADIWEQGWEAGMSYVIALERGHDDDENATNPYRASETA